MLDQNNNFIEEGEAVESDKPDYMASTCLYPKEPAASVIVNHTNKNLKVKKKRKNEKYYDYAPGEEQCLSNWIREKDLEEVAFPEIFTTGQCGYNNPNRQVKISRSDYLCLRFSHHDKRCAKNSDYLFVSQQFSERHLVENNISVKGHRGKFESGPDGAKIVQIDNPFDVFTKIPGTPSYLKNLRNELFARMEQLGAFHFFSHFLLLRCVCQKFQLPFFIATEKLTK